MLLCINMDSVTGNLFWHAIGHGGLKEGQVFNKLVEAYDKENKKNLTDEQVLEAAGETQEKLQYYEEQKRHCGKRNP